MWPRSVVVRQLVVEYHVQQRLIYANAAVVFDEAESAKAIHKEADP